MNGDILEMTENIDRQLDEEIERERRARRRQMAEYEDEAGEDGWIVCARCSGKFGSDEIDKCHACGALLCEECEDEHPYTCGE